MTVFEISNFQVESLWTRDESELETLRPLPLGGVGKKLILSHKAILVGLYTTHQDMLAYMCNVSHINQDILYLLSDINMHIL